jgi:solute carrier family 25 phosphate transporter 23/24/25/41
VCFAAIFHKKLFFVFQFISGMVTFPFDTIRRILQSSGSDHMKQYSPKFLPTVKRLYQEEGILRFYRGGLMNMMRMGAQAGVAFYTYETVKGLMHSVQPGGQIDSSN